MTWAFMAALTLSTVLCLAAIHLWIGRLRLLSGEPRSVWLSLSGGVAVAYVFLHILPDLAAHRQTFAEGFGLDGRTAGILAFSVALAGLTAFYGLERLAAAARQYGDVAGSGGGVFWLHLGSFAAYNALIGYLVVQRAGNGRAELVLFGCAMATHFVTTDFGLRDRHRARYDRVGRWILAAAVLGGWAAARAVTLSAVTVGFLFAFLGGSAMLNILKEELPENRQSRFWAFLVGAGGYAVLLAWL